ncbi:MAG: hypothetical protein SF028_09960 [Candidatus Sumerlaeia bacterium]|nr:hypothetical protein [Candidatus Sumerlaeia bacterium]
MERAEEDAVTVSERTNTPDGLLSSITYQTNDGQLHVQVEVDSYVRIDGRPFPKYMRMIRQIGGPSPMGGIVYDWTLETP